MANLKPAQDADQAPQSILLADHYSEPPGYRIQRPSGLKDWFITFTNAGQGRYLWADKEYICSRGDLVVLPAGIPQDYGTATTDRNWEHYWVHVIPQPLWLCWLLVPDSPLAPYICHISDSVSETHIVENFERLLGYYRTGQKSPVQNAFQEILLITVKQHAEAVSSHADKRISIIVQYLFQHLNEAIDIPMLAELVAMSPSRLVHLFREEMHTSIMQMLTNLRLSYAVRLLRFSSLSIGQISAATGFQSQFYFSRRFKAHFGCGPREYQKRIHVP